MRKYPVYFILICMITVLFSLTAFSSNAENTAPTETLQENTAERTEQAPAAELTSSSETQTEPPVTEKDTDFKRTDSLFSLCGLNCNLCPAFIRGSCGGRFSDSPCFLTCPLAPCNVEYGNVEYCYLRKGN